MIGQCCNIHGINSTVEIAWYIFRIRDSAGRNRHLEILHVILQQCTNIIKMPTLKTYFSYILSNLMRTRSQITSDVYIRVTTKLPNSEQSNKGKVKTHKYINRQNQSTTGKLWKLCYTLNWKSSYDVMLFMCQSRQQYFAEF